MGIKLRNDQGRSGKGEAEHKVKASETMKGHEDKTKYAKLLISDLSTP